MTCKQLNALKPDLVFAGNQHSYERFHPIGPVEEGKFKVVKSDTGVYQSGDPLRAARELEETLAAFPSETRAHELLGRIYYEQGRIGEAVFILEKGLSLMPASNGMKALLELHISRLEKLKQNVIQTYEEDGQDTCQIKEHMTNK